MISFIVPCFNEEKYIGECIRSIKSEVQNIPHEIIVVDNNCTDNTTFVATIEGATVVTETQKGVVFAKQKGYQTAKYDLIANIDADSRLCKGWVEIALKNIGRPLGNTALIGAFAAATGELKLDNLIAVVKNRFSGKAQEGNIQAVKEGFEFINNMKSLLAGRQG